MLIRMNFVAKKQRYIDAPKITTLVPCSAGNRLFANNSRIPPAIPPNKYVSQSFFRLKYCSKNRPEK